jgi:hypothetical protein
MSSKNGVTVLPVVNAVNQILEVLPALPLSLTLAAVNCDRSHATYAGLSRVTP